MKIYAALSLCATTVACLSRLVVARLESEESSDKLWDKQEMDMDWKFENDELEEMIWEKGTWQDMHDWLECSVITDQSSYAIHNASTWKYYRETYHKVMRDNGAAAATKFPLDERDDFQVPMVSQFTRDIGRGNFANAFIPKGTLVWTSDYVAEFPNAALFRRFLRVLPTDFACEVLHFMYTTPQSRDWSGDLSSDSEEETEYSLCVDLSSASFTNGCDYESECNTDNSFQSEDDEKMVLIQDCKFELYATRDIQKGEEILMHYAAIDEGMDVLGMRGPSCCFDEEGSLLVEEEAELDEESVWERGTIWDMHAQMECSNSEENHRSENRQGVVHHNSPTWTVYRETYQKVMEDNFDEFKDTPTEFPQHGSNDYQVPVIVQRSESSSGVFADAFIPKGTLIWTPLYVAEFRHAVLYRRFLRQLPKNELACEILPWTYSRPLDDCATDNGETQPRYVVCVEMSTSAYMLPCLEKDWTKCNAGYDEEQDLVDSGGCSSRNIYATQDIRKGEEILFLSPYDDDLEDENLERAGLL